MSQLPLNERIRAFYDASTPLWLNTWGEHMHHGYYGATGQATPADQEAQVALIEVLLEQAGVQSAAQILDAGCGVGGSARYLARRFGAQVLGVTLSPVQAAAGQAYNQAAGLADQVEIRVQDMMTLTPGDAAFDLIWSMESAEHIADKARLVELFFQWLKPGGRLLLVTWCTRATPPAFTPGEAHLLQRIGDLYHLPPMVSKATLQQHLQAAGFQQVEAHNWTRSVAPFWGAVIRSALRWRSLLGLLRAGWSTLKGAWAMQYMTRGYRRGLLEFAVLWAEKPQDYHQKPQG